MYEITVSEIGGKILTYFLKRFVSNENPSSQGWITLPSYFESGGALRHGLLVQAHMQTTFVSVFAS